MTSSRSHPAHRARWALLPLLCALCALPAEAQTSGSAGERKAAPTAAKKQAPRKPARKPAARPAPKAAPAPAPVEPAATAAPASAPAAPPVASAPTGPREADFIVAVVNTEPVTNNEVRARMARMQRQLNERGQPMPPSAALQKEVLERLIAERAQMQ